MDSLFSSTIAERFRKCDETDVCEYPGCFLSCKWRSESSFSTRMMFEPYFTERAVSSFKDWSCVVLGSSSILDGSETFYISELSTPDLECITYYILRASQRFCIASGKLFLESFGQSSMQVFHTCTMSQRIYYVV